MECEIYGRVQIYTGKVGDFFYWTMCDVCEFILEGFYSFTSKLEGNCKMCGSVHRLTRLY
jgi:hypothetical protein